MPVLSYVHQLFNETAKLWGDLALIGPEKMMYKLSTEWS